MDLFEETLNVNNRKQPKEKNTTMVLLGGIAIVIVICIAIIALIMYLQTTLLSVKVNGVVTSDVKKLLVINEEKTSVYAPIKKIAPYLGYEAYAGDYTNKSEDTNMCYIQCENEVAIFTKDSKEVQKIQLGKEKKYETVTLEEAVQAINGELFISVEGLEKSFNTEFQYDTEKNKINIYTLPFLVQSYQQVAVSYGYVELSTDFINEKAIFDNILIVKSQNTAGVQKWAAIYADTGKAILEPKYDSITYIKEDKNFFVTSESKVGILSSNRETKIEIKYDSLTQMGEGSNLYKATLNGKAGVIDEKGNIIIHLEYDDVGINISSFETTGIKNGYILLDKVVPVKNDGKWALYDLKGNVVVDFTYKDFGCIASGKNTTNLLILPEYKVIVVKGENGLYTLVTAEGNQLFPFVLTDVYKEVSEGTSYYYMTVQGRKLNVDQYVSKAQEDENNSSNKITTEASGTNQTTENDVDITDNTENGNVTNTTEQQ